MIALLRKNIVWGILVLALLPFVTLIFTRGFGYTDGGWMVVRQMSFHETLRSGQFPVRFLENINHGYGYPVLNFLYPLPFYLGEALHLMGADFVTTIKLLFALSFFGGAVGMLLFVRRHFGDWAGVFAAIIYSLFPYHLFDIFTRGSLGEVVAFFFLPLVFFFADGVCYGGKRSLPIVLLGFGLAGLITSHNTLTLLFLPVILGYFFILIYFTRAVAGLMLAGILGLLLSAFFWLPALLELSLTRASSVQVAQYYNYFLTGVNFPDLLGVPFLFIVIALTVLAVKRDWKITITTKTVVLTLFLSVSLIAVALSTQFLEFLWQAKFLPQLVQFPWRFLAVPTFTLSVIGGVILARDKRVGSVAIILLVLVQLARIKIESAPMEDTFYQSIDETTTVKNEYMPLTVKTDPLFRPNKQIEIVEGKGEINDLGEVTASTPSVVQINKVYFPGTKVFVNGQETTFDYETTGYIRLVVPAGRHQIVRKFSETPLRLAADLLTALGFLVSGVILVLTYRKNGVVARLK